jgi:predicted RNA binding protein YcfA (HicA-like mRNA interferase family)
VIRLLEAVGFEHVSTRGSHVKMRNATTGCTAIVPNHKELAVGTLASILRQAGLSGDEFRDLLDR